MARQRSKLDLDDQDEMQEVKRETKSEKPAEAEEKQESGVEYGKQSFPPKCPICGVDCKSYGTRGPVTYYRCENEECERCMNFTVKQSRPWRNTFSRQMDVGARPNMG